MQKILVTGGAGFIGSNFIRYLFTKTDFQGSVINLDKLTYAGNPKNLSDIEAKFSDRYHLSVIDLCDRKSLEKIFLENQIDVVVHFAAESHVDRSIEWPDDFIQTNIVGTFNLLEFARRHKDLKLFHHVSTDEVFGTLGDDGLFTEETSYKPNSPYSASKASSDHLVRSYHETYKLPVTISNCSNNYGPFHFPEKLIPLMILNAMEGKALPVYGQGLNIRDWLYVEDHCDAIWKIINSGKIGETYNVGGRCEMKNIDVVKQICQILDSKLGKKDFIHESLITYVKDRPGHDWRYAIDCSKIEKELGWLPSETFESGLEKTINWYLENQTWVEDVRSGDYRKWIDKQYSNRQ